MQEATPFSADVIVVGAGLAGLVAADRLRATGLDVTVLEGADRLGGRTYGAHWAAAGREIDLGGTWLLPGFTRARELLAELGIPCHESPEVAAPLTHLSDGVRVRRTAAGTEAAELDRAAVEIAEILARSPRPLSAAEALARVPLSRFAGDWHRATQRYLAGAELSDIDARHLLLDAADLRDPDHYATQITGTTKALVDALAARSQADIRLGASAAAVATEGTGYRVTTHAGESWRAPALILAVPRNVLATLEIDGPIRGPLADLAARRHPGASRKDWFVLDGVHDHFRVFASEGPFGYFRSEARLPDGGMLAVGLAPGAGAVDRAGLERGIRAYLPGAEIRAHTSHDWRGSPWARGTWFVPAPGDPERLAAAQQQLAAPGRALYLAGGDVSPDYPGTIEGAIRTGIDAAERAALQLLPR
ncbi:flavin monoamine oxidase family protein [Leucobacter chromiireducens]|uniref:FAD-dependent oxidoreductase n=1 Tax=Leucobacter chromiireducens subsp. solipictus TaxID=398235 RepID=A0ABS1SIM0_9MICO|nr:NAD(P)/FAD-dependent oxidoreductase [Leucobacter chromiireducens]MBL3680411.1 FAD-dependent oxidoreductase [Leucobacter chromiireducens subsp. solipictus]